MFKGIIKYSKQSRYLFELEQEMECFIHFYQYVDGKIESDRVHLESDINEEEDVDGQFMGYSGPVDELEKLNSAPKILYKAVFIALYSFLEIRLNSLIDEFITKSSSRISRSDLNAANDMQKSQKYLDKVLGLDLSDMEAIFEKLHDYRKIRNAYVHNNGYLSKEKDGNNLISKVQKNNSLYYVFIDKNGGYVSIKNSMFIRDFSRFIPGFLGQVFNKLYPEKFENTEKL